MTLKQEPSLEQLLAAFDGELLDRRSLSSYEQWALDFFPDPDHILDPNIDMTLQVDISEALAVYRMHPEIARHGSFTARLTWALARAVRDIDCFCWRRLDGRWYRFNNLPLFIPIATGQRERFGEMLIENALHMDWPAFAKRYRERVNTVRKAGASTFQALPEEIWRVAVFIGNLPGLRFTSLRPHQSIARTGRPIFYFGQRYLETDRTTIPFAAYFDHANVDPVVLEQLLATFQRHATQAL